MKATIARTLIRMFCASMLFMTLAGVSNAGNTTYRFPERIEVQGAPVVINGSGTRHWAIFKVYEMAIYLPKKSKSSEEIRTMPGAKHVELMIAREIGSTELGRALVKGMRGNATPEQMTRHTPDIGRLISIFSSRNKLVAGDLIGLDYVPGRGTYFIVGGERIEQPVGDAEFFSMLLNIWLGDSPVEPLLKDALLGQ